MPNKVSYHSFLIVLCMTVRHMVFLRGLLILGALLPFPAMAGQFPVIVTNPRCHLLPHTSQGIVWMTLKLPSSDILESVSLDPPVATCIQLHGFKDPTLEKRPLPDGIFDLSQERYLLLMGLKNTPVHLILCFQRAGRVQVPLSPPKRPVRSSFCQGDPHCVP